MRLQRWGSKHDQNLLEFASTKLQGLWQGQECKFKDDSSGSTSNTDADTWHLLSPSSGRGPLPEVTRTPDPVTVNLQLLHCRPGPRLESGPHWLRGLEADSTSAFSCCGPQDKGGHPSRALPVEGLSSSRLQRCTCRNTWPGRLSLRSSGNPSLGNALASGRLPGT